MPTHISPMLAVVDAGAAIEFYRAAFGATVRWQIDTAVAELDIDGAPVFLAEQSPPSTRAPKELGSTSVRIELFVDDPHAVLKRAVAAGATLRSEVTNYEYPNTGPGRFTKLEQGSVLDPSGHIWLVGKLHYAPTK